MGKERAWHGSSALLSVLYDYLWRDFHGWLNAWPHLSSLLFSSIYASLSARANRRHASERHGWMFTRDKRNRPQKLFYKYGIIQLVSVGNHWRRFGRLSSVRRRDEMKFFPGLHAIEFRRERHFSAFHRLAPWVDYWARKNTHNWREFHTSDRLKGIRNEDDVRRRRLMVEREKKMKNLRIRFWYVFYPISNWAVDWMVGGFWKPETWERTQNKRQQRFFLVDKHRYSKWLL